MSIELADLDGDGDSEVIMAMADGTVEVLRNVGKKVRSCKAMILLST